MACCKICEWWDAPGKRDTGYCLYKGVTAHDFCCEKFSQGDWKDRWSPESVARRKKREEEKAFEIPNVLETLREDVLNGKRTGSDAAEELHQMGWMNYIDEDKTKRLLKL